MNPLRIAYCINSVEGGGAAAPVPAVARVLGEAGCEVRILALTRRDGRGLDAMAAAGLDVRVRDGGSEDHLAAHNWLDRETGGFRPDVIWTSLTRATMLGQLVGLRRGLPVVSWQHAAYLKAANLRLLRFMRRRSALWIGDSTTVTDLTAERLDIPQERLATWPLFAARADAPRSKPWQPGEMLRLGSLGRLHPVKGYDVLIDALGHLRAEGFVPPVPIEVTLAGDGAQRDALVRRAADAGVDMIRFAGFTDRPAAFLAGLHLYVQPSLSEGLCIAAHEAMVAGLPVIASAVGELPRSILPGVTGRTVPPGDPIALADAIANMLRHPSTLHAMGWLARERMLHHFGEAAFAAAGNAIVARVRALSRVFA